jgi:hypothetical protein
LFGECSINSIVALFVGIVLFLVDALDADLISEIFEFARGLGPRKPVIKLLDR